MADHLGEAFVNINGSAEGLKRTLNDLDKTGAKAGNSEKVDEIREGG